MRSIFLLPLALAGCASTPPPDGIVRARLDQRIRHLQQLRDEFTDCVGCGCLSIDRCRVINANDKLGAQGSGPRRLLET